MYSIRNRDYDHPILISGAGWGPCHNEVQPPPIEKPALCLSFSHVPPWPTWNIFTNYCWIRFSKIQENSIFTGKMERPNRWWNMSAEPWDLSEFFPISIVTVGVTFIKIIWRFVQNGPNWSLFLLKTDFIFLSVDLNQSYHCSVGPSYN